MERHLSVHLDRRVASGSVKPVKVRNTAKVLGARTLARLFKKELVVIASDEPILYGDSFALGDTIFVRSDAESPFFVLLGHELSYHLRAHDEGSFRRLQAAVLASISKEGYKTYKAVDRAAREKTGVRQLTTDEFTKWEFWRKLAERDHPLLKKLVDWLSTVVTKLANKPHFNMWDFF